MKAVFFLTCKRRQLQDALGRVIFSQKHSNAIWSYFEDHHDMQSVIRKLKSGCIENSPQCEKDRLCDFNYPFYYRDRIYFLNYKRTYNSCFEHLYKNGFVIIGIIPLEGITGDNFSFDDPINDLVLKLFFEAKALFAWSGIMEINPFENFLRFSIDLPWKFYNYNTFIIGSKFLKHNFVLENIKDKNTVKLYKYKGELAALVSFKLQDNKAAMKHDDIMEQRGIQDIISELNLKDLID